tara:strand:+ start:215 stop:406 length:192 start_codon:yes stop_codon:yes gene_type:complete
MQQNILFILSLGWLAGWLLALRPYASFYKRKNPCGLAASCPFYKRERERALPVPLTHSTLSNL